MRICKQTIKWRLAVIQGTCVENLMLLHPLSSIILSHHFFRVWFLKNWWHPMGPLTQVNGFGVSFGHFTSIIHVTSTFLAPLVYVAIISSKQTRSQINLASVFLRPNLVLQSNLLYTLSLVLLQFRCCSVPPVVMSIYYYYYGQKLREITLKFK